MPIRHEQGATYVTLGTGDVFCCTLDERPLGGDRFYVLLTEQPPGAIGSREDTGRAEPIRSGDIPNLKGGVVIETDNADSVAAIISTLKDFEVALRADARAGSPAGEERR